MLDIERRINSKEQLIEWLEYEKRKYGGAGTFFSVSEGPILYRHQKLLRKTEFYFNTGKMVRYRIYNYLLKRIQNKYCLRIPLNCCDRGLKIMHLAPVLVNPNAIIGKDCSFHMNSGLVAAGKMMQLQLLEMVLWLESERLFGGGEYIFQNCNRC